MLIPPTPDCSKAAPALRATRQTTPTTLNSPSTSLRAPSVPPSIERPVRFVDRELPVMRPVLTTPGAAPSRLMPREPDPRRTLSDPGLRDESVGSDCHVTPVLQSLPVHRFMHSTTTARRVLSRRSASSPRRCEVTCRVSAGAGPSWSMGEPGDKYGNGGGWAPPPTPTTRTARESPRIHGVPPKTLLGLPWRYAIGCIIDTLDPSSVEVICRSRTG